MIDFKDQVIFDNEKHIKDEPLLDNGLYWVKSDSGSWHGPHADWLTHRENILGNVDHFNVCVQAGGNLGLYPRLLSSRFKVTYTFEPDPLNFYCLSLNNTFDNVIKINTALGENNELVSTVVRSNTNLGMNQVIKEEINLIPTFTIDQLQLNQCDLIWLDIEGYENKAINGAKETIKKFLPLVAIETEYDEIRTFLESLGYNKITNSISDKVYKHKET